MAERLVAAADHEAVAYLQAPDAAGGPGVHDQQPLLLQLGAAPHAVAEVGVAAIDNEVPLVKQAREFLDGLLRGVTGGHHHPGRPRSREPIHKLRERTDVRDLGIAVVTDHLVAAAAQPLPHVAAHAAKPDHA